MVIWLQTEVATDLSAGDGKAEGVLAGGGELDGLHLGHVLVLGHGHLNLNRGSHGIGVAESSVSESMVAKTVVSEAESVGQDGRGSLDGGLLVSGPLPAGLALLQAGDGVAEGVLAAGLVDGILNDGHGHLDLVHHGLGHGVGVAESMVAQTVVASKAAIGQTPV